MSESKKSPQKLTMLQNDQINENFEKLKALFPHCVTEIKDPDMGG